MPWKEKKIEEQRLELVRAMKSGQEPVKQLCERYGVSRQTGYKWLARFRASPRRALKDRSRRPLLNQGKTDVLWLRRVRRARGRHPTWGARKLKYILVRWFGS